MCRNIGIERETETETETDRQNFLSDVGLVI